MRMEKWSLRIKLTVWIASWVTGTLLLFGAVSAWSLYQEQLEAFRKFPQPQWADEEGLQREAKDVLEDLVNAYAVLLPCAVLVAALGVWFLTGMALHPVREIAEAAERIHARALHQRIREPLVRDEIGKLAAILNRMFERLEKSFAQSSRFSADASHELKTPLTLLRAEIEAALKRKPADAALLENLLEQTQRISGITEKLLLLTRADAGQLKPEKISFDLSGLCTDLIEDAEILAEARGIRVEGEIAPGLEIKGDVLLLRQALLNLLDNAIKYNVSDGCVRMILRSETQGVAVEISNTGPGIPPEDAPRVFERFYRTDLSRSSETGGNGLGLSICREIILAHGGQIRFENLREGWTSFVLHLPIQA